MDYVIFTIVVTIAILALILLIRSHRIEIELEKNVDYWRELYARETKRADEEIIQAKALLEESIKALTEANALSKDLQDHNEALQKTIDDNLPAIIEAKK